MRNSRQTSVFVWFLTLLMASLVALPGAAFGQTTGATPTASPAPNPALTLSSPTGAPGSTLTVNGVGFRAGETVTVSFNGEDVGTPTAGTNGGFSLAFTVPNLQAGKYGVTAEGKDSGVNPSTTFEISLGAASLTWSVPQAAAGSVVSLTGAGFQPGEQVMLHFNGPEVAQATADKDGNVNFSFTIPASLAAGTYGATAMGAASGVEVNSQFVVTAGPTPAATAQPTAAPAPAPAATPVPAAPPAAVPNAPAMAHDDRYFSQTGFRIDNDQVWSFFQANGGISTFGYPTSRMITFLGCPVQFFQRQIIQVCPSQGPALINMLDPEIFPYTEVNGSHFPAPDPQLKDSTPPVSSPTYAEDINAFVTANVPDQALGMPVNFFQTFNTLGGLNIWGAPISHPQADPSNANFIYQRFQRGIMHFTAPSTTESILLADYLKAIITGQNVPADLAAQSHESRFANQYCPGANMWLCRPNDLSGTDLTFGFVQG